MLAAATGGVNFWTGNHPLAILVHGGCWAAKLGNLPEAATSLDLNYAGMNASDVAELGEAIAHKHERCDILVNNAAIGIDGKFLHEITPDEWDLVFNTNLRGPYLMIRALTPLMIAARSGHIINISSLAGRNPLPKGAAYAASKWGLNGLTYSVAEELRQYNIRVSVVSPGSINTDFNDHSGRGIASGKDPKRKLQPDDIASVVATLVTQPPQCFISEVLVRPTQKP